MILTKAVMSHKCSGFGRSRELGPRTRRSNPDTLEGRASPSRVSGAPRADADNHVHAADFGTGWRHGQTGHRQFLARYVLQLAGHFTEKVVVEARGGAEI